MITKEDIEKSRTPDELFEYVEGIYWSNLWELEGEERKRAKLKKGLYREFYYEVRPLGCFAKLAKSFYAKSAQIRPVLGNQGYDAEVLEEGVCIGKIEICSPVNGKEVDEIGRKLIEEPIIYRGYPSETDKKRYDELFLGAAEKKSEKDYSDCDLVIIYDPVSYFIANYEAETKNFVQLISKLKEMEFKARRVHVLFLPLPEKEPDGKLITLIQN